MSALTAISLFSGIGGFDLDFEQAGIETVAQVEIDDYARGVLALQFPDVPKWKDITDVRAADLPPASIVYGGTPCRDLSVAGDRAGLAGKKSSLFHQYIRIIDEVKPEWMVWENVPGALHSNGGRDFAVILNEMGQRGYKLTWRVLDAQYFGVPQRRRRVFVVGHLRDGRAAQILFERQGEARCDTSRKATRSSNAGRIAPTLNASGSGTSRPGGQGAELGFYVYSVDVYGQNLQSDVSHTLTSRSVPSLAHLPITDDIRRFTPIECERLQGFPDNWTAYQSDAQRYKQTGNAVAVPVARWIGERIVQAEHDA